MDLGYVVNVRYCFYGIYELVQLAWFTVECWMLSRISLVKSNGLKLGLCDLLLVRCVEAVADDTNDASEVVSMSLPFSLGGFSSASKCAYLADICSMSLFLSCVLWRASV